MGAPSRYSVSTGLVSENALAAGSRSQLLFLGGSGSYVFKVLVMDLIVSCGWDQPVEDVALQLYRMTLADGPSGNTGTLVAEDPNQASVSTFAATGATGAEPTHREIVRDIGIPPRQLPIVFRNFGRYINESPSSAWNGLGLVVVNDGPNPLPAMNFRATVIFSKA
jgi:hypothetical protein